MTTQEKDISTIDEVITTLNDAREKLNKIEDTETALDLLDKLTNIDSQMAVIKENEEKRAKEIASLKATNGKLLSRVAEQFVKKSNVSTEVNYDNIDNDLGKIISIV